MSETLGKLKRQYEHQMNEIMGQIHVQETVLLIALKRLLEPQENAAEVLRSIKDEAVAMVSQTKSLSGDPQDTQRIQGSHSLLAEQFFQPLEEYFQHKGSS